MTTVAHFPLFYFIVFHFFLNCYFTTLAHFSFPNIYLAVWFLTVTVMLAMLMENYSQTVEEQSPEYLLEIWPLL